MFAAQVLRMRNAGGGGGPPITVTLFDQESTVTLSGGSLTATKNGMTGAAYAFATEAKESGKFYFEVTVNTLSTQEISIGLAGGLFLGERTAFLGVAQSSGIAINSNTAGVIYGSTQYAASFVQGDIIGVFVDATNGIVWFSKNGTVLNGSPSAGTGGTAVTSLKKAFYPAVWLHGANSAVTFNFGGTAFSTSPPAGFQAWNASSPQTTFTAFRSSLMWIRSLGFFSHAMAEFELMATSGGANVLSGATVTSSASVTGGALANLVDASTSTYCAVGNTGSQNQANAYFAFELGSSATRNVAFAAVRGRDGGGGSQTQAPTLFDLWLSTGTVSGGIWYRAKPGVSLSAFAATTPGERKEFAVP